MPSQTRSDQPAQCCGVADLDCRWPSTNAVPRGRTALRGFLPLKLLTLLFCVGLASAFESPQNLNPQAQLGRAVDICGDRMAVSDAFKVNIYQRTSSGWVLQGQVPVPAICVQIEGDVLAIANGGPVLIYEQEPLGGSWTFRTFLTDPAFNPDRNWLWGRSIALDHHVLVVGGRSAAVSVSDGFATVFERSVGPTGSVWTLRDHLVDPAPEVMDPEQPGLSAFGLAVAVSGQTIAVSSWNKVWLYRQDAGAGRQLAQAPRPSGCGWYARASMSPAFPQPTGRIGQPAACIRSPSPVRCTPAWW
jgi:hypothetical protein